MRVRSGCVPGACAGCGVAGVTGSGEAATTVMPISEGVPSPPTGMFVAGSSADGAATTAPDDSGATMVSGASAPIHAIGAPTGWTEPSAAMMRSGPSSGASTVMSALSVSISTMGCPRVTTAPSGTSQPRTVPSSIVSLSLGISSSLMRHPHVPGSCEPRRRRPRRAGSALCSRLRAYGIGTSAAVTRRTGASSQSKHSS